MAEREAGPCAAALAESMTLEVALTISKGGVFHYRLPEEDLALRSVRIVNGVPKFRFAASPKVPTITDEDVAAIFRLVSEGKRPEFYYKLFPSTHPIHMCRYFKVYSPAWLRWTAVGKLLADADWTMKCLHIGTKSNKEKSDFKSWSAESKLEGLASRFDFPDGPGSIWMSCEYVKVQKEDNEVVFLEEPKMKISAENNPLYSKYITEIYPSVAYHDEPLLLKMQELIKLIVAIEWLYREKGVRPNQDWMMQQRRAESPLMPDKRKTLPYDMIPKLTVVKRPTSDVIVKTRESLWYEALKRKCGVERQYGSYDVNSGHLKMFKEDGTPCQSQKCALVCVEHQLRFLNMPVVETKEYSYLPLSETVEPTKKEILELLPKYEHQEITSLVSASVDTRVEDFTDEHEMEFKVTTSVQPHVPITVTSIVTVTMVNHYATSMPIELPYCHDSTSPDVTSRVELLSELSDPIPWMRQDPFMHPIASGGVTTNGFEVREEAKKVYKETRQRKAYQESWQREVYQEPRKEKEETPHGTSKFKSNSGPFPDVPAECIRNQGKLVNLKPAEFAEVSGKFSKSWKGTAPSVSFVFGITNSCHEQKWEYYKQTLNGYNSVEQHYHGTTLACNLTTSRTFCSKGHCGICGISNSGPDPRYFKRSRFGKGFYLTPNSSRSDEYTKGYRAVILCDVLPGCKYKLQHSKVDLPGPPAGYHSVYGEVGPELKDPEIVLYEPQAVMPRYIIIYK